MEQGPEELSDRGEERTRDLERSTDTPLDQQGAAKGGDGDDDDEDDQDDEPPAGLSTIDPGL